MTEAKATDRPLSPHLQIYRWTWTMAMSVFHRATGFVLYFGVALLAIWLLALASGQQAFETAQWFFGSPVGLLILFGYTWALMHHLLGGVRHLIWDMAIGMDESRFALARFTLIGSVALTLAIWVIAFLMF